MKTYKVMVHYYFVPQPGDSFSAFHRYISYEFKALNEADAMRTMTYINKSDSNIQDIMYDTLIDEQ